MVRSMSRAERQVMVWRNHREDRRADGRAGCFVAMVRSMSRAERQVMVWPALRVRRQCGLLSIGRSSFSDTSRGEARAETLVLICGALMRGS